MATKEFNEQHMEQHIEELVQKDLKAKYAKILEEQYDIQRHKKLKVAYSFPLKSWAAVAASLIIVISIHYVFFSEVSTQQLASTYIQDTNIMGNPSVMRKDVDMVNEIKMKANDAFVNKNYGEAVALYTKLAESNEADDTDLFYLGTAILKNNPVSSTEAVMVFQKIKNPDSFSKEIRWLTALALLHQNKVADAKPLLQAIISEDGYMAAEAKALVDTLS